MFLQNNKIIYHFVICDILPNTETNILKLWIHKINSYVDINLAKLNNFQSKPNCT